jgi:hypothetical protein
MERPQNILLAKLASFAQAINKLNRKLQPQAANAKQVHWVAGADARNGFQRLKQEIWPKNE